MQPTDSTKNLGKPMQDTKLQTPESTRKTINRHSALSKALRALYLEVDASIVESIEVYVANALNTELSTYKQELIEWADKTENWVDFESPFIKVTDLINHIKGEK